MDATQPIELSPPPQLMASPEGRGGLDPTSLVLRNTSLWVGWLPRALMCVVLEVCPCDTLNLGEPEVGPASVARIDDDSTPLQLAA